MEIRTSKGGTFKASWIWGPMRESGQLMIELANDRKISEVAEDFEGCSEIRARRSDEKNAPWTLYEEYTRLISVTPGTKSGYVHLTLAREAK